MQEAASELQIAFLSEFEIAKLNEEDLKKYILKLQTNYNKQRQYTLDLEQKLQRTTQREERLTSEHK